MKLSCIVPYYNECKRINSLLSALKNVACIDEILLIDDGSTDEPFIVDDARIKKIRFETNQGKAAAIRYGVDKANGDVLMFLDADLKGITHRSIEALLKPVLAGETDVSISRREYLSYFDVVSGERVIKKKEWEAFFKKDNSSRNGLEIAMNRYMLLSNLRLKAVKWPEVKQEYKSGKIGFIKGMIKDINAVRDWMRQMGSLNFSVTYLFFWMAIIGFYPTPFRKLYQTMYSKKYTW